ncbi:hypothetical protein [Solimonas flava]|uniref:hypothetical protein n=1 Tax=Solimonas flava TaxID=415849 RepID=UPI000416E169|nr:hypothetical protein [Solimonas flava]
MLNEFVVVFGPLKLVIAGLLFFNLAWIAVRKWFVLGVIGVSAGEISLPHLWAQAQHLGVRAAENPGSLLASAQQHAGSGDIAYILLGNALLAVAIWFAVRSLQLWARATVKRHEEEFWELVEHDERQWRGVPAARYESRPGDAAPRRHF